jgi:hypothetical protein
MIKYAKHIEIIKQTFKLSSGQQRQHRSGIWGESQSKPHSTPNHLTEQAAQTKRFPNFFSRKYRVSH